MGPEQAMTYTISAAAKELGFDRRAVAAMCKSGELPYIPCRDAQGRPSKVHKRIDAAELEKWKARNTIRNPEQFKAATDRRRK